MSFPPPEALAVLCDNSRPVELALLYRLRDQLNVAIGIVELGQLKNTTHAEQAAFRRDFGNAHCRIGDFIVTMTERQP